MFGARERISRRAILAAGGGLGASVAFAGAAPAYARLGVGRAALTPTATRPGDVALDLDIDHFQLMVGSRAGRAMAINQTVPGPLLRFREGETAVLRVTNRLQEIASIHWHGILLPPEMDGVPGVSFGGIGPGEIFTYRFPIRQSGTYWCHSHSGGQELLGVYAPFVIDPTEPEPFAYERDYVVLLSDWSFETPGKIIRKLKKQAGYYNYQKRTMSDLLRDAARDGWGATLAERQSWARMRMDPTDFADVTGQTYAYLINGLTADANWTGLFQRGERVRLRFIAAGAMTYFDIRIPGLKMTVVQADGQNVRPVEVDEFRIAPGETFDMIVTPEDRAYTVFAEAMDRSGFARGTLAPRHGMTAPIPPRRKRPLRTMADMGMDMAGMAGAAHSTGEMGAMEPGRPAAGGAHAHGAAQAAAGPATPLPGGTAAPTFRHGPDTHGVGNSATPQILRSRLHEPGAGFDDPAARVLVYADLQSPFPQPDQRPPARDVELHITGNMDRYMWSFDGKTYSQARTPIPFAYGERLRLVLINDTMMEHPIHLHGMWMELENGAGAHQPRKHTVSVKPAERLTVAITADAPGPWAMHCHLLLHMEMGMFRVIEVSPPPL